MSPLCLGLILQIAVKGKPSEMQIMETVLMPTVGGMDSMPLWNNLIVWAQHLGLMIQNEFISAQSTWELF